MKPDCIIKGGVDRRGADGRPQRLDPDARSPSTTARCSARTAARCTGSSLTFVSEAALAGGLARKLKVQKKLVAVENTRGGLRKKSLIHNGATPKIEIDAETYAVTADGELSGLRAGRQAADGAEVFFVLKCRSSALCGGDPDGMHLARLR